MICLFAFFVLNVFQDNDSSYSYKNGVLAPVISKCERRKIYNNFNCIYGIKISKYYDVIFDRNIIINDALFGYLILSPVTQRQVDIEVDCDSDESKRLLVVIEKKKTSRISIYENVIPDTYDFQYDPLQSVFLNKKQITILFNNGTVNKCFSTLVLSTGSLEPNIVIFKRTCYDQNNDNNENIFYKKFNNLKLKNFKILDYILP